MPRDGAGVFALADGYQAVSGEVIQPSQHNPPLEDLATGVSDSIARTGVTAVTADIPFGGFRLTGVGDATADTDALNRQTGDARYRVAIPVEFAAFWGITTAPTGYLKANGAAVSVATYANLLGLYCGDSNNATADWGYRCTNPASPGASRSTGGTHIVLPDARGEFLRGWDDSRGIDTSRNMWLAQAQAIQSHTHGVTDIGHTHALAGGPNAPGTGTVAPAAQSGNAGAISGIDPSVTGISINSTGGTETRPRNLAFLICVKF